VRELRNVVERIALLAESDVIDVSVLESLVQDRAADDTQRQVARTAKALLALPSSVGSKLEVIERAILHHAIEVSGGNKSAAARLIGVDRKALERKWDRLSDEPPEPEGEGDD
jgi:two-component system response regulator HydG